MKDFFKMLLASLAALFLVGAGLFLIVLVFIGALAASGDPKPVVGRDSVLVLDLSVNLLDAPAVESGEEVVAELFGGGGPARLQLRKAVDAIHAAADDGRIKAIYLQGEFAAADLGSGFPALMELRGALARFRDSGKPVIAYLVGPSSRELLVGSVASKLVLHPMGVVMMPGLNAEVMYLGGTFEKFGIGVQVARAGEYKSAGEAFVERRMSAAEREQLTALLEDVWGDLVATVAESRRIPATDLQALIDREGLLGAEAALEHGLVDVLMDFPDLLEELKELTGRKASDRTFRQVSLADYIAATDATVAASGDRLAVIYAEGEIVDGEGGPGRVGGDGLAREIRKLRREDDVKAVVLRVNSPGGSAIASEVIRRELELLHARVPVVVSMGTVAASGGYWISTASNRIYAQPNTITGSIGVVAIIPNIEGLAGKIDLNFESVKTGRHADVFSLAAPRSPEGMGIVQGLVDDIYDKFLERVAASRGLERAAVEPLAGGRVWSGRDALERGLVDELGGLDEAIAHAADLADLDAYSVVEIPGPVRLIDRLLERFAMGENPAAARGPGAEVLRLLREGVRRLETLNDPNGVYALMPHRISIR